MKNLLIENIGNLIQAGVEYLNLFRDPKGFDVMPTWETRFYSIRDAASLAFYFMEDVW